ncbi:hypothetical protein ACIRNY_08080 [Capnocytophaga canimorsus]|uniref:hypothetical protein n=1 Tax=Capnocytophaga canimorsus TaxID=28188 RepID=UPI00384FF992
MGRSTADFSTKFKTPLALWDSRKQRLLGKSHAAVQLNQRLNDCTALIHTRYRELCEREEAVTAPAVRDAYQGQAKEEAFLLAAFEAYLRQIQERIGIDRALKTFKLRTYQLTSARCVFVPQIVICRTKTLAPKGGINHSEVVIKEQ